MACKMVLTYLHFRVLKIPLSKYQPWHVQIAVLAIHCWVCARRGFGRLGQRLATGLFFEKRGTCVPWMVVINVFVAAPLLRKLQNLVYLCWLWEFVVWNEATSLSNVIFSFINRDWMLKPLFIAYFPIPKTKCNKPVPQTIGGCQKKIAWWLTEALV